MTDFNTNRVMSVKDIDTPTDFITVIESCFNRQYKTGMKNHILQVLRRASQKSLQELYQAVLRDHEKESPPKFAELRKIAYKAGIGLTVKSNELGVFCCVECGKLYPVSDEMVMKCGGKIAGNVCGSISFATKKITTEHTEYSFLLSKRNKYAKEEAEIQKKMKLNIEFDKIAKKAF